MKAVGSPYAAGRRGSNWIKVKPVHTYDLVVLACEWGSGRRAGLLSNLHLGALDPTGRVRRTRRYVMVGKTFKGLTDALLRWQTERFQELEVRRRRARCGSRPTTVVEIAIDGVQRSTRYPAASRCGSRASSATATTSGPEEADTIRRCAALLRG